MRKGLTIYTEDDTSVAYLHGTIYLQEGETATPINLSFSPPDDGGILVRPGKDIMAVAYPEPQDHKVPARRRTKK